VWDRRKFADGLKDSNSAMKAHSLCSCQKVKISAFSRKSDVNSFPVETSSFVKETITNVWYGNILCDRLKPPVWSEYHKMLWKDVLLCDNAYPDAVAYAVATVKNMTFEVLQHSPYSPYWHPDLTVLSHYEVKSYLVMVKWKKQCKNGLRPNQNHFIVMESLKWWTVVINALNSIAVTKKDNMCLFIVWLFFQNYSCI